MVENSMQRRIAIHLLLALVLGCSSCASQRIRPLPFGTTTLNPGLSQIALISFRLQNAWSPPFLPIPKTLTLRGTGSHNTTFNVKLPAAPAFVGDYYAAIPLPAGAYVIEVISGRTDGGWVKGVFEAPIEASFELQPGKLQYLGHIEAINRERTNSDQIRAGPIIPIIDQSMSGFSTGTWKIRILDQKANDLKEFQTRYPVLANATITVGLFDESERPSTLPMKLISEDLMRRVEAPDCAKDSDCSVGFRCMRYTCVDSWMIRQEMSEN